ncbi:conserved exported protein of unknown function [Tenacibaculum sp. 190130A14a]|uniref:Uncharacterized protein n=1 Tax=Tenacibaculum polynesiense TaxID=3137857 RepID=A0ABM9P963_9FLAO
MKKIVYLFLMFSITTFAQKTINNYKYVIIPNQFSFFKTIDKYETSSLTKFLFNKYGFKAFLSSERLPEDLEQNGCLALKANVKNNSGMFTTKNVIELKDCNGKVVFTSVEGRSRKKQYKDAYHEAIRNAFKSVQQLNYVYVPSINEEVNVEKDAPAMVQIPKVIERKPIVLKKTKNVLYAQAIKDGFQLVNTKPEIIFYVLKTNLKDVFVIKGKDGVLYKSGSHWVAEFYKNGTKKIETYEVKF